MKIEGTFNQLDEIQLGIFLAYGNDDNGDFHLIEFGFLIFTISIYRYL